MFQLIIFFRVELISVGCVFLEMKIWLYVFKFVLPVYIFNLLWIRAINISGNFFFLKSQLYHHNILYKQISRSFVSLCSIFLQRCVVPHSIDLYAVFLKPMGQKSFVLFFLDEISIWKQGKYQIVGHSFVTHFLETKVNALSIWRGRWSLRKLDIRTSVKGKLVRKHRTGGF